MGANNVCESNKCKNSGICKPKSDEIKGYICSCPSNYTGAYCEHSIDLCKDVDCEFSKKIKNYYNRIKNVLLNRLLCQWSMCLQS